jgi:hypothetical protein
MRDGSEIPLEMSCTTKIEHKIQEEHTAEENNLAETDVRNPTLPTFASSGSPGGSSDSSPSVAPPSVSVSVTAGSPSSVEDPVLSSVGDEPDLSPFRAGSITGEKTKLNFRSQKIRVICTVTIY